MLSGCVRREVSGGELIRQCMGKNQWASLYRYEGRLYLANSGSASKLASDADLERLCPR